MESENDNREIKLGEAIQEEDEEQEETDKDESPGSELSSG